MVGKSSGKRLAPRVERLRAAVVVVGVAGFGVLAVSPGDAYRFTPRSPDVLITLSADAPRWDDAAFPLPFRVLDNEHVAGGLAASAWSGIARSAFRQWEAVSTATVRFSLTGHTAASHIQGDGFNDIGFSDALLDSSITGIAYLHYEWGEAGTGDPDRIVECDVDLNPGMWDPRLPQALARVIVEQVATHEIGHCFGLMHTEPYPLNTRNLPDRPEWLPPNPDFLPPPVMAYTLERFTALAEDDKVGASLLHPAPGFAAGRGSVGGRLVREGVPMRFAFVQAVLAGPSPRFGPGAFADENGFFLIEGLRPGPTMLWVHPMVTEGILGSAFLMARAEEAGVLEFPDAWRWIEVEAGQRRLIQDIELGSVARVPR